MIKNMGLLWLCVITFASIICVTLAANDRGIKSMKIVAEWKDIEYEFPSNAIKQRAIANGEYVPGNGIPIDVNVHYKDAGRSRVFITVPRFVPGIPITFGTLTGEFENGNPLIQGYPDYSWQNRKDCFGIVSVFRTILDKCDRLWVLDAGRIGDEQKCPPQLLIFNINTDKLIHRYVFPSSQYTSGGSIFITPVVDVRDPPPGNCADTMVYMGDTDNFGIVIYDYKRDKSWRAENKLMYPVPKYGTFTIAGTSFDLMDGLFGMAVSPKQTATPRGFGSYFGTNINNNNNNNYNNHNNYNNYNNNNNYHNNNNGVSDNGRVLYFHALASITENTVPLSLLDNSTIWENDKNSLPRQFIEIGSRETQATSQALDKNGNLFFGIINPIGIACWDTSKPYSLKNMRIVAQDDKTLQFVSGLKIIENRRGAEELWALSSAFQKIAAGTKDPNEVTFRVQALKIDEILGGKKCLDGGLPPSYFDFPRF